MTASTAFYTDEDVATLVATLLQAKGWDVTTVPEQSTLSISDRKQLEFAVSIQRCLITHNRVDFERLHIEYVEANREHYGIIVVPQQNPYKIARRIEALANALSADEIANQLLYA